MSIFSPEQFQVEGQFIEFSKGSKKKPKYVRLAVADRLLKIKLSQELRKGLNSDLVTGDRLQVVGQKKFKKHSGKLKLKAQHLIPMSCSLQRKTQKKAKIATTKKAEILVCQKSDCLKRGSKKISQKLEKALCDLGLENQVKIKGTGCQSRCKKAPNITLMPGKNKCGKINPNKVMDLLEQHFLSECDRARFSDNN